MKKPILFLTFILSGCMVGPNYTPPQTDIPDLWTQQKEGIDTTENIIISWWDVFQDPLLSKYIKEAEEKNYDLQKAEANILQARAIRQIAASSLFPQISADVDGFKTYFSKNGPVFAIGPAAGNSTIVPSATTGLPFQLQIPQIQNLFNALFDASWELDLFGKTRRAIEQADAMIGSSMEQKNDLLISIFSEIAINYIELRSAQEKQRLLQEEVRILKEKEKIIEKSWSSGYKNRSDVEAIQRDVANMEALIPESLQEIYKSIYTLSILTGNLPETLFDELIQKKPLPCIPEKIAVGLRSDLLRRRPDIRKAERELAAATAGVGIAVAAFFPVITLSSFGGFQSLQLPKLLEWDSKTWGYGADINMPLYQGGKTVGYLRLSRAIESQAASSYQQTVLNALQESETFLSNYEQLLNTHSFLNQGLTNTKNIVSIASEQFNKGLATKLQLLTVEERYIQDLLSLLNNDTNTLTTLISLYKSLGGGWEKEDPQSL